MYNLTILDAELMNSLSRNVKKKLILKNDSKCKYNNSKLHCLHIYSLLLYYFVNKYQIYFFSIAGTSGHPSEDTRVIALETQQQPAEQQPNDMLADNPIPTQVNPNKGDAEEQQIVNNV